MPKGKWVFIAVVVVGALLLLFWYLTLYNNIPSLEEGGELPFIPCKHYIVEKGNKPIPIRKSPLQACVEMVMHYWGTPPTEAEIEAMMRESLDSLSIFGEVLRKHRLSFIFVAGLDEDLTRKILELGIPVLAHCNIRDYQGIEMPNYTWVVIKEFKNGELVFNDPESTSSLEMDSALFFGAHWQSWNTAAQLIFPPSKKKLLKEILPSACFREGEISMGICDALRTHSNRQLIGYLRKKQEKNPSSPHLNYSLGWRLTREGKLEGLKYLQRAIDLKPLPFYRIEYATSLCYVHRDKEALQRLLGIIEENPKYISLPTVFFHLCFLFSQVGKVKEIDHLFQRAFAIAPLHLLGPLAEIYTDILIQEGRNEEAIKLFQTLFAKYPQIKDWMDMELSFLSLLISQGRLEEAERLTIQLRDEGVPAGEEYLLKIKMLQSLAKKNFQEAEEIYKKTENLVLRTIFLRAKGEWKELQNALSELLRRFTPRNDEVYETKAWDYSNRLSHLVGYIDVCRRLKDYDAARKAIEDFLNIYENTVVIGYERVACYNYAIGGMICYWDEDKKKAEEWLLKACHSPYFKDLVSFTKEVEKVLKELGTRKIQK